MVKLGIKIRRQVKRSKTKTLDRPLLSCHFSKKEHSILDPDIRIWRFSQKTQTYSLTMLYTFNLTVYN